MNDQGLTRTNRHTTFGQVTRWIIAGLPLVAGGCVSINAPDKPIEINLNISVTQEVVYRLDSTAKEVIKDNPDIF